MAMICGLATTAATRAASTAGRTFAQAGRTVSQGSRASVAAMIAKTADSWSVSSDAPRTTPRITGLPPPRPPAQPHRRLQRQRNEQRPDRQVEQIPALVDQHGGQAEEGAGGDRARLGGHPKPCHPVHRVTQQARHDRRQQVVGNGRAEGQCDGCQDQAGQWHQGMKAELRSHRGGEETGEKRVGQVLSLPGHPPEVPHVGSRVSPERGQPAVHQIAGPRPADGDPGGQIGGQDR